MDKPIPEAVAQLRRLADVIRRHGTIPSLSLEHIADALTAAQQQGGGECTKCRGTGEVCTGYIDGTPEMFDCTCPAAAPPSAPMGAMTKDSRVPDDYRNQASGYRAGWNDALASDLAQQPAAVDEPDVALLISMATCLNHGFGLLDAAHQQAMLNDMRKLWAEVVGIGYYSPTNRERYLATQHKEPKS